jgi:CHAD domain-containing protein
MSGEEFVRFLLSNEVSLVLKYDPEARRGHDPEGVHQLRVGIRRLRSELKMMAPAIQSRPFRHFDQELKWCGRVLGQQRDLDVLGTSLLSTGTELPIFLKNSIELELAFRQRRMDTHVVDMLESDRYGDLVASLADAVVRPPLRANSSRPAIDFVRPSLKKTLSNLFDRVDGLDRDPSNDDLHRIRILAKRARYVSEVAALLVGNSLTPVSEGLESIQTCLGELHDSYAAVQFLEHDFNRPDLKYEEAGWMGSTAPATERLNAMIKNLRTSWREPLERVRSLSTPFLRTTSTELRGAGLDQHAE